LSEQSNLPPSFPTLFVDRSLGRIDVPTALRRAGRDVVTHDELFKQDEDDVWIRDVSQRDWVILSKDLGITYNPAEKAALLECQARAFLLRRGELRGAEMARIFVSALPKIDATVASVSRPFIAKIYLDGSVRVVYRRA
jgi:hypothetical protein